MQWQEWTTILTRSGSVNTAITTQYYETILKLNTLQLKNNYHYKILIAFMHLPSAFIQKLHLFTVHCFGFASSMLYSLRYRNAIGMGIRVVFDCSWNVPGHFKFLFQIFSISFPGQENNIHIFRFSVTMWTIYSTLYISAWYTIYIYIHYI